MEADHVGREGMVDNVGEGFGHLDSIFSFSRGDKMLSVLDIGRESFEGWPPTALGRREHCLEQSLDMEDRLTLSGSPYFLLLFVFAPLM